MMRPGSTGVPNRAVGPDSIRQTSGTRVLYCPTTRDAVSPTEELGLCQASADRGIDTGGFRQPESPQVASGAAVQEILQRLDRIESALSTLMQLRTVKDFYSTDEVAGIVGKAEFTVREWARHGRINAQKRRSGRGKYQSWVISHEELQRIQREGLLPEHR